MPLGSPMSTLLWGPLSYCRWPTQELPGEFRKPHQSDVETLLLSGSVDFSTPPEFATKELLPYLKNGRQAGTRCRGIPGTGTGCTRSLADKETSPIASSSRQPKDCMKKRSLILLWSCFVAATTNCLGQDSTTHQTLFPCGISVQAGAGYLALRDEHISDEKYAGSSSWFALLWSRFHETYGFRIGMTYQKALRVTNFNISAEVTQGAFTLANLYPIGTWTLLGKDAFVYLGPSAEAFVYYRRQNIAQNTDASPNVYQSNVWLVSLGAGAEMILPFNGGFQLEGALRLGLLSLGGGTGNDPNTTIQNTLLTAFAGFRGHTEIGLRYYLFTGVSVAAGYRLEVTRISSWNEILSSTDNAFASLAYHF